MDKSATGLCCVPISTTEIWTFPKECKRWSRVSPCTWWCVWHCDKHIYHKNIDLPVGNWFTEFKLPILTAVCFIYTVITNQQVLIWPGINNGALYYSLYRKNNFLWYTHWSVHNTSRILTFHFSMCLDMLTRRLGWHQQQVRFYFLTAYFEWKIEKFLFLGIIHLDAI